MKKFRNIVFLLVACLVFASLAACGGSGKTEDPIQSTQGAQEATKEPAPEVVPPSGDDKETLVIEGQEKLDNLEGKKIAAVVLIEDQFQRMLQITMKKTAEKYGANVLIGHSGGELDKEVELINNYATGGVDGICIFPVSLTGSVAALQNAASNGSNIYCANMNMNADWQLGYAEMDQYGMGVLSGEYCAEYIKENFPDRKPKVAIIQFTALLPEMSKLRVDGFLSQTKDLIEIVHDVDAWDSDVSVQTAAEVMNAHPDLDMFFCANEGGTVGTVMAIKNAGKKIPVFGIDFSEQLGNMLLDPDNILQALGAQDPVALGETTMDNLCLAMMGKEYQTGILLPGLPFTRGNPDGIKSYIVELKTALGE